jgi:hypothetical protein
MFGASPDNSLFGRSIPCSGNRNSLFRLARESVRKPFAPLRDFVRAVAAIIGISNIPC